MSDRKHTIVFPCPVKQLDKLGDALSRMALDGYAIMNSSVIQARDGQVIVYILQDVREPTVAVDVEEETETPETSSDVPETLAAEVTVTHTGKANGATELPNPEIVGGAEA